MPQSQSAMRAACENPARTTEAAGEGGSAICWIDCATVAPVGATRGSHCGLSVCTTNSAARATVTACAKISQSLFNTRNPLQAMTDRATLDLHLTRLLEPARFKDYGPNGLQVEGRDAVHHLVCGVTASLALIDAAIEALSDAARLNSPEAVAALEWYVNANNAYAPKAAQNWNWPDIADAFAQGQVLVEKNVSLQLALTMAQAAIAKYGGRYLVRGGAVDGLSIGFRAFLNHATGGKG